MSAFFKQIRSPLGRIPIVGILLGMALLAPIRLVGQSALSNPGKLDVKTDIIKWEKGSLRVWMSPSVRDRLEKSFPVMETASIRVFDLLGQRPVEKPLTIWLLRDDSEFKTVLLELGYAGQTTDAIRSKENIVLKIDPGIPFDWILRYILSEYANYILMNHTTGTVASDRMEWLRSGMGIGIGWYVAEEIENGDWTSASKKIASYYGSRAKPDATLAFKKILSTPWGDLLKSTDKSQLISRCALLYIWIAEKNGPTTGNAVLSMRTANSDLDDVLQKSADVSVEDLQKRIGPLDGPK